MLCLHSPTKHPVHRFNLRQRLRRQHLRRREGNRQGAALQPACAPNQAAAHPLAREKAAAALPQPRLGVCHEPAQPHVVHIVVGVVDGQPLKEPDMRGSEGCGMRDWAVVWRWRHGRLGRPSQVRCSAAKMPRCHARACPRRHNPSPASQPRRRHVRHPAPVELEQCAQQLEGVAAAAGGVWAWEAEGAAQGWTGAGRCAGWLRRHCGCGQRRCSAPSLPSLSPAPPAHRGMGSSSWNRAGMSGSTYCPTAPSIWRVAMPESVAVCSEVEGDR